MRRAADQDANGSSSGATASRPAKTLGAARGSTAGGSGVNERTVKFLNNETKKTLCGTLRTAGNSKKVVILCHGLLSHRNGFHFPALATALAQKNICSFRVDFTGNGDSEGTIELGNYQFEAKDIRAAVLYLRGMKLEVTGLIGHSKGAGSALLYASLYDDVPALVSIAARFNMKQGLTDRLGADLFTTIARDKEIQYEHKRDDGKLVKWTLTKWSLQDRLDTDMEAIAKKVRLTEVLSIVGSADRIIPASDSIQWGKHIATHQLQVVDGGDHNFTQPLAAQAMIALAVQFVVHD